jgi:hypothetical protein
VLPMAELSIAGGLKVRIGCDQRKRPPTFLLVAFIYAGNDLLSHTLGACSTIGPAGLNFRVRDGNGWIPRGKITDNLRRFAGLEARREIPSALRERISSANSLSLWRQTFKERENEVSQLNRLVYYIG